MATPYELAYLSNYSYSASSRQQSLIFSIPPEVHPAFNKIMSDVNGFSRVSRSREWAIIGDNGISDGFYASKFQCLSTGEFVIAFRGTGFATSRRVTQGIWDSIVAKVERGVTDLANDVIHLSSKYSPYVLYANNYLKTNNEQNLTLTGHSLGGFLAMTMGYFNDCKVVAFNPPHQILSSPISRIVSTINSSVFSRSKMIVYESSDDYITMLTRYFKRRPTNIKYVNLGSTGGHSIEGIQNHFSTHGSSEIIWNF